MINRSLQQPKGEKILGCKAKPNNGKKNSIAHAAMENKSAEITPVTENVLTTQTEKEGMLQTHISNLFLVIMFFFNTL